MSDRVEEAQLEIAGQKISLKSVALNTFLTVMILAGVIAIAALFWRHENDTRETGRAFVEAIKEQTVAVKEQTVAAREQNCLMRFDTRERQERADFCRQIAR